MTATTETTEKTITIRVGHQSSIQGAVWCSPVGWEPANNFAPDASWVDGSWWEPGCDGEECAGLVYFGDLDGCEAGDELEVDVEYARENLRVAKCGSNCGVIGHVEFP